MKRTFHKSRHILSPILIAGLGLLTITTCAQRHIDNAVKQSMRQPSWSLPKAREKMPTKPMHIESESDLA